MTDDDDIDDSDGTFLRNLAKAISPDEGMGEDTNLFSERLEAIATRYELLEKAHGEQKRTESAAKKQEEEIANLLTNFATWMIEAHEEDPDNVEVEHFQVLAMIHLGTQIRAAGRTMSMGSAIGGIGGLLSGIGAAALERTGFGGKTK